MPAKKSNLPATIEHTTEVTARHVYDAEKGQMVEVSDQQIHRWHGMTRIVEMSDVAQAIAIKHIADEKLFLAGGFSSFKEYAETSLPFGYRSAQRYLQVGRKLAPILPGLASPEATPVSLIESHNGQSEPESQAADLTGLGIRKLHELVRVDDAVFEEVVDKGRLVMPDGETTYSIDDLKSMKTKQLEQVVKEARMDKQAYQARVTQLEEEKKLLESERKADAEKLEKAERELAEARELERLYGPARATYEQNDQLLSDIAGHLFEARRRLFNLGLTADSADGHKNRLLEIVRDLGAIHHGARMHFAEVIDSAEDTIQISSVDELLDKVESRIGLPTPVNAPSKVKGRIEPEA